MKKILIVEDEVALLESLVVLFEMHEYKVTQATNGTDAIRILEQPGEYPDVVVCDINLPDITGYEVLRFLRNHNDKYRIPLIFLSAYADKQDVRAGMDLGADDYITKPFSLQVLLSAVNAKLEKHKKTEKQHKIEIGKKWAQLFDHNFRQEFYEPLNVAINASKMCMDKPTMNQEEIGLAMTLMLQSCYRMFRNSRNLILYSSLNARELTCTHDDLRLTNIDDILNNCINQLSIQTHGRELQLNADVESHILCLTNREIMDTIFTELIDNAIRFTGNNSIEINARKYGEQGFMFTIMNNTKRPTKARLSQIHPFTKFHNDVSHQGFGLGLYIVKELCNLLGYNFDIDSKDESFTATVSIDH